MQQHQVGALFGLFVRTIGAARFVCAIAPVAALVAVASIPLPRAASPIEIGDAAPSSAFVQVLAQRAGTPHSSFAFLEHDRPSQPHAVHRSSDLADGSPAARIGDRWLRVRAEQRAMQSGERSVPKHVGERLLHVATAEASVAELPPARFAFARLGESMKPVASGNAAPRAPPAPASSQPEAADDPQPAAMREVARTPQTIEPPRNAATAPRQSSIEAAPRPTRSPPETLLPLKLSEEQRNISRFVARRYRVKLDDVQRFVAHAFRAAREFGLDPYLVLAVMSIESSFNPNARSSAGAQGLMQVLTRVHLDKFAPFGGAHAALDPVANITVGSRILKEYLVREGTVEGALKSYVGAALLPHDFGYGNKVLTERARIAAAARTGGASTTLAVARKETTKVAMAGATATQTDSQAALRMRSAPTATRAAGDRGTARDAQAPRRVGSAEVSGGTSAAGTAHGGEAADAVRAAQAGSATPTVEAMESTHGPQIENRTSAHDAPEPTSTTQAALPGREKTTSDVSDPPEIPTLLLPQASEPRAWSGSLLAPSASREL
ncbi:MAG TPA: transglycosylase SLT domain-containing protein [Zeimonas sp.]|nr:transglycosylase SLT domain-containing protein [Zeimonas sp.]